MRWAELVWTRERAAREGVSRARLTDGAEFVRVVRGRYVEVAWSRDLRARSAAALSLFPRACLSHWTSLELAGLPVPASAGPQPLHLLVPPGAAVPRDPAVRGHRSACCPVVHDQGLPVAGTARSWCDVAALQPRLHDLVAAGDAMVRRRGTAVQDIQVVLGQRPGGRGVTLARRALELLDPRAESPQESRLRVVLTLGGLPPPAVNHVVRDSGGRHLARVDLAWPAQRLAVEYDGEHHRSPRQWLHDLRRREALERAGWRVVVVVAADLRHPAEVVHRVQAALAPAA